MDSGVSDREARIAAQHRSDHVGPEERRTRALYQRPGDPHHIGILLFDGVEELDAVGP